ncbi:hypothetical protein NDU88_006235, partial [Pleurodeles waltl]
SPPRGDGDSNNPLVEITGMVPDSAGTLVRVSSSPPGFSLDTPGSVGVLPPSNPSRSSSPHSLEDFRHHWQNNRLSQEANNFIAQAWAPGTCKRYRSAWNRWSSWCVGKHCDPMGASIADIINFLAELAASGL